MISSETFLQRTNGAYENQVIADKDNNLVFKSATVYKREAHKRRRVTGEKDIAVKPSFAVRLYDSSSKTWELHEVEQLGQPALGVWKLV